ncbi:ribonuclease H-like domain-containing protein [Candidatus Micrarchaeota archaeon]|nr:ribonuclease H-like domain-containing protein [Candidatus Micrarchaeota archaeon]
MKRKKAYFIDAGYVVREGKTYVTLLLKGRKTVKLYYQQDPYFLVEGPVERADEFLNIETQRKNGELTSPKDVKIVEKQVGLEKKRFIKVMCRIPADVPVIRQAIPFPCYEYSIPFARRFIYDMQISPFDIITYEREGRFIRKILKIQSKEAPKLKILAFDIETYNPVGAPREHKDPIIMISYAGDKKGVISCKKSKNRFVETVKDEKQMLERFVEIVKQENPDVLVGYNSATFDLPYLKARSDVLGIKLDLGRFRGHLREMKKGLIKGFEIKGRIHFDIYPIARLFGFIGVIKVQKYTLDAVAEDVLGKKKIDVKKEEIWKLWDSGDIDKLAEYSLVDSELTKALGERFLPLEVEMSSVAKMPLFQTSLSTSGQLVESLLMFHACRRKMIIPRRPAGESVFERINAPIQGAFVKLPEPGIYENMAVLDFRGLYPSIIVSYNIDPGTLVEDGEAVHLSPTNAKFSEKETGLIPEVLDYLVDMRSKIKGELKELDKESEEYIRISARSQALKILSNSFYGYLGYARSRWYSRPCAESVTAWGRKHINETIEKAEKQGFQVLYADTDSVFLIYREKNDVLKFMNDINNELPEKMELELEGFYPRGVFVSKKGEEKGAKKKYALLAEDGRIKIRGFELVRRDWSKVAKQTQKQVLEAILIDGSKEKAVKIIREMIQEISSGKVPLEMLAISTQLNKNPGSYEVKSPELSAAKKMIKAGMTAEKGSMISYVVGKKGTTISEKAEPIELAKDYDPEYYISHQILPAVMKIMKELGYDEYSMRHGGKQQSLDSFF